MGTPLTIEDKENLTKRRLMCLNQERNSLVTIPERIRVLEMRIGGLKAAAMDGDPVSGGESHQEDTWISNIDERSRLETELEANRLEVAQMDREMKHLQQNERLVLQRFYVTQERFAGERLAEELGYSKSQIHRIKEEALAHLARRLYG